MVNANLTDITSMNSKEAVETALRSVFRFLRSEPPFATLEKRMAEQLFRLEWEAIKGVYGEPPEEGVWGAIWNGVVWKPGEQGHSIEVGAGFLGTLAHIWSAYETGTPLPPVMQLLVILGLREMEQREPFFQRLDSPYGTVAGAGPGDTIEVTALGRSSLGISGRLTITLPKQKKPRR